MLQCIQEILSGNGVGSRWLCHAACCLAIFNSGVACIYPIISDYMLIHYNLTHSQVGSIAITSMVGESLYLPAALIVDSVGPKWTLLIGLLLSCVGWLLTWWSSIQPIYNQPTFYTLSFIFFIQTYSRTFCYSAGFVAFLQNTSSKHRAKLTAFLDALFEVSVLIIFVLYRWAFLKGQIHGTDRQNSNFLFVLLIGSTIFYVLSIPFTTVFKDKCYLTINDNEQYETICKQANKSKEKRKELNTGHLIIKNEGGAFRFIFSLEYQLLLWGTALSTALPHFILFNITPVSRTLQIPQAQRYLYALFKAGIIVSRFVAGFLFDRFHQSRYLYFILLGFVSIGGVSQGLFLVPFHPDILLGIAYFCGGVAEGAVFVAVPICVIEVFGLHCLGRNVSLIYTMTMILTVLLQITHDVYNDKVREKGACFGTKCIFPVYAMNTLLALLAVVVSIGFALRIVSTCSQTS